MTTLPDRLLAALDAADDQLSNWADDMKSSAFASLGDALQRIRDEAAAALSVPEGRCKTVIVYGDRGPEEREPVEDYYDAPPTPSPSAVEALAMADEGRSLRLCCDLRHLHLLGPKKLTAAAENMAMAAERLAPWMAAALGDDDVCAELKADAEAFLAALAHPEIAALLKGEKKCSGLD